MKIPEMQCRMSQKLMIMHMKNREFYKLCKISTQQIANATNNDIKSPISHDDCQNLTTAGRDLKLSYTK